MRQRGIFEKLPGSSLWWIRYADQFGRIHREKIGPKKLAISAYQKRKTEVREGRFFPDKLRHREVPFAEIARDALEYSRQNKAHDSYRADCWHMETFLRWFRERAAAEITPQEIERKLAELAEEGRKPATLNRYRALLSLTYSLANRNGKLSVNPARLVRRRKENNARVRFLDEQEEVSLRGKNQELHPDCEPELDVALHTGMRRGEQYRLRWQDVDFKRGLLTIPRSKHGERRHVLLPTAPCKPSGSARMAQATSALAPRAIEAGIGEVGSRKPSKPPGLPISVGTICDTPLPAASSWRELTSALSRSLWATKL